MYEHAWRDGDFVVFDNTQMLHQATDPQRYEGLTRHLQRIEMRGSWSHAECIAASQWQRYQSNAPAPVASRAMEVYPISVRFDIHEPSGDVLPSTAGAVVVGLSASDLSQQHVREMLQNVWKQHKGLLVVRGASALSDTQLQELAKSVTDNHCNLKWALAQAGDCVMARENLQPFSWECDDGDYLLYDEHLVWLRHRGSSCAARI